jgi:peptide chain release factor subunit 1
VGGHEFGMQLQEMTSARLRALTEVEIPAGRVVSLYLNLDPESFGTIPARQSAVRSAIDELGRRIDDVAGELGHDELVALREDRARIEEFLTRELDAEGAHGVAIFACAPADLWEVSRLPHTVDFEVAVDTVPHVEQLARDAAPGTWAVVPISRSRGRILRGDSRRLVQTYRRDDDVHGQHDQGGWSQPRYMRSVDREADAHVRAVLDALYRAYRQRPFDHLLFVAAGDVWPAVERGLHADLEPLLSGRVAADAEIAGPDEILEMVRPEMERVEVERELALVARLSHGLGTGERAAAGLQPTLDALLQQRVEALLLLDGFATPGAVCRSCGWMGADADAARCPVDGEAVVRHDNIADVAIASALQQNASVLVVPRRDDPGDLETGPSASYLQLQGHGGIAAVLRF